MKDGDDEWMSDEEVEACPNHLLWTEDPETGMSKFSCRATGGCLLVVLVVIVLIIILVAIPAIHHGR